MQEPAEELFVWLRSKVIDRHAAPSLYTGLLQTMHNMEFVWYLLDDSNRAEDGLELRRDFYREVYPGQQPDLTLGCSFLEMLIAFSYRAEFQTGAPAKEWFWIMVDNIGLGELRHTSPDDVQHIEEVIFDVICRNYDDAGNGSLFPVRWPRTDMRELSILYQFFAYVQEEKSF